MRNYKYNLEYVRIFENISDITKNRILENGNLISLNKKEVLFNEKDVINKSIYLN